MFITLLDELLCITCFNQRTSTDDDDDGDPEDFYE